MKMMSPNHLRTWVLLGIIFFGTGLLAAQDLERKLIKRVEPDYPSVLKDRGIGGIVRLKVIVRADGTVKDVSVLGGNSILIESAVKAVKQWRYASMEKETSMEVSVQFDPHAEPKARD